MATPLLWEYPTTSSNVASMPNPNRDRQQVTHTHTEMHEAHGLLVITVPIELKHDTQSALNYVSDTYEINAQSQSASIASRYIYIYIKLTDSS